MIELDNHRPYEGLGASLSDYDIVFTSMQSFPSTMLAIFVEVTFLLSIIEQISKVLKTYM